MAAVQTPPALFARSALHRLRGRVHFPEDAVGATHPGADEEYVVFREMTLDADDGAPEAPGAVFVVRFRFARFSAAVNKRLSLIPAPFIAAQPGFRSKRWMLGTETGMFQGVYRFDSVDAAEAYWTSFPMQMMKRRAVPGSVTYEIAPVGDQASGLQGSDS